MSDFEQFTKTPEAAQGLIDISAKLASGEIFMLDEPVGQTQIIYYAKPETRWAETVDAIETDFAPDYDQEEYQNPALQMLNLAELGMLASMLGIAPPRLENKLVNPEPGKTLLDVGCGTGRIAIFAAANGQSVTAFDQTAAYVNITANKLQFVGNAVRPKLLVAPAETMVEDDQTYDNITAMFAVLNHCEDWAKVLERLPAKLKSGGSLGISMYGSPGAAVFKALDEGLPYKPGILVKRVVGGLMLGDSAADVLPAAFPYPNEVKDRLEASGAEVQDMLPFLCVTSLFPRDPVSENIASYLKAVKNIYGQEISEYLSQFKGCSQQLLVASLCADYKIDPDRINDAAYYGIVAKKEG